MDTILRLPSVMARTGLSRSTLYLRISQGSFPKSINLGARAVGWLNSEIDAWLSFQIKQSREQSALKPVRNESSLYSERGNHD